MEITKISENEIQVGDDFRIERPQIENDPSATHYGFQGCASLIDGRWEGFATLIETEAGFKNINWIFDKYEKGLTTFKKYLSSKRMEG